MGFIIGLIIVIAIAIALCFALNQNISRMIPLSISIIILTLFLAAIIGVLVIGAWVVIIEAVIGLIFSIYNLVHIETSKYSIKREAIINPSLLIFLVATVLFYFITKHYQFCYYDEFSHWGTVIKDIFVHRELCSANANEYQFINYPPGLQLFQWLIMYCNGGISEGLAYEAYTIFGASFLLIPFEEKCSVKGIISNFAKLSVFVFIPFLFYNNIWSNLQVDPLLGVICFFILYVLYTNNRKIESIDTILLSMGIVMLTLTKDSGFAIGILLAIGIIVYQNIIKSNKRKGTIFNGVILTAPTVIVKLLWEFFWRSHGTSEIVLQSVAEDTKGYSEYKAIVTEFINKVFEPFIEVGSIKINLCVLLIFLVIIGLITVALEKEDKRKKLVYIQLLGWIIFAVYTIGTLYVNMTLYPFEAAIEIPGFKRYLSTILLGIILLLFMVLINELGKRKKSIIVFSSVCIIISCYLCGGEKVLDAYKDHNKRQGIREDFKYLESVDFKESDLVYVVTQRDSMAYYVANYCLAPTKVEKAYIGSFNGNLQYIFSLRKIKQGENNYAAWDISCKEWEGYLYENDFDYVYLHTIDDYFIDTFGVIFDSEIKEQCVYRIESIDGHVRLLEV